MKATNNMNRKTTGDGRQRKSVGQILVSQAAHGEEEESAEMQGG